jgi:hypothetical protein
VARGDADADAGTQTAENGDTSADGKNCSHITFLLFQ